MGFILDTNAFNRLIDGKFSLEELPADAVLLASHIQIDEINKTSDSERRARLMLVLAKHVEIVPTETVIADVSRFGEAKLSDGTSYNAIRAALDSRNKRRINNIQDALIGEIALVNSHTLVTADGDLAKVMESMGCAVKYIEA